MKRTILCLCLMIVSVMLIGSETSIPRVYIQKLVLDNGTNPYITAIKDTSAPEYNFKAWIIERPEEVLDTDKNSIHHLAIKQIGNGTTLPYSVVATLNLGNFVSNWLEGETMHFVLTHKETSQVIEWDVVIPEGGAMIKMLDEPLIIPPYTVEKVKEHGKDCGSCPNNNH